MLSVYLLFYRIYSVKPTERVCANIYCTHTHTHTHLVECVSWAVPVPASLMRSRSSEVGGGQAIGRGHVGLTIKDECKRIPVEKEALEKTSPRARKVRQTGSSLT